MDELRTQIAANEEHRKHEHEEQVQQGVAARARIAREMALIEVRDRHPVDSIGA